MKKVKSLVVGLALVAGVSSYAQDTTTQTSQWAVTADVGLALPFGPGIAGSYAVMPKVLNARAQYHFGYTLNLSATNSDGFTVKPEIKFQNFGLYADWFPFEGSFRVTGGLGFMSGTKVTANGAIIDSYKATITATGDGTNTFVKIGDKTYTIKNGTYNLSDGTTYTLTNGDISVNGGTATNAARYIKDVRVDADIKWDPVAPYIGIGYGNPISNSGQWSFFADFGLFLTGKPSVSATITSNCASTDKVCQAAVQEMNKKAEEAVQKVRDDAGKLSILPNLAIGVSYSF